MTLLVLSVRIRRVSQKYGRFFVSTPPTATQLLAGIMLNRTTYVPFGTRRALPLRNVQFSHAAAGTGALRGNIVWFTPEAIIIDALSVLTEVLFLWQTFRKAVPTFAFRTIVVLGLIFLLVGFNQRPDTVVAGNQLAVTPKIEKLTISTQVVAKEHPIFTWPIRGGITSLFSSYHRGIDITAPHGAPIKPLAKGKVVFAGWNSHGFGNTIIIQSVNGFDSKYAHLSGINVRVGESVGSDAIIGFIGDTGVTTGPHLHFEVYKDGLAINPLSVLP
ncbi:MAG: hypothetical protein A2172_00955 [Candidatus Woykebacteria bacterium RBG_13_40_15]|uniref:M23ase beta-sheet core domain-containing protein n=1 Tax=Candidatus Woykebacteria bacterium RBG_13_40_15 TaxID=1802593 RepID=A0A1G1W9T8_9BACT|nr:MAG: hypothetical protein A2172_00955 [Candidatus Woykebacteria bacterium RBG_13_40_15]